MYATSTAYYIDRADCHMREQLPVSYDRLACAIADADRMQAERTAHGNLNHSQYTVYGREGIVHVTAPCCEFAGLSLAGYTRPARPAFELVCSSTGE